jgi:RNA polymerase sigma-70 factor (ECF subfamily)
MSAAGTLLKAQEPEASHSNVQELEHLALHNLPKFVKQAYRHLGNAHDAEDAVQDALVSAYENLSRFRGEAQLSTWFMAIVTNAARMQRRRRRLVVSLEDEISPGQESITLMETCKDHRPGPDEICANAELRNLLLKATQQLPPAYRRVIRLYYMQGMTGTEVSEALGIPVGTIKAQGARARAKLAKLLCKELGRRRHDGLQQT